MSSGETPQAAFERGQKQGVDDATLAAHTEHLRRINGSVDHMTAALTELREAIHARGATSDSRIATLERNLTAAIAAVASDVRTLNEDQRSRDVKVEAARATLAEQTERRRDALEEGGWKFTRWQQTLGLLIAITSVLVGIYFATGR